MRGMHRHQKEEIFLRRSKRGDLEEIKVCGLGSVSRFPNGVSYAPRSRDSSYFGLFSILGAIWLSFNVLRGCLKK